MRDTGSARRRGRVLLVEDEPLISDIAAEALQEQGFEVETAANAGDALRRLAADPSPMTSTRWGGSWEIWWSSTRSQQLSRRLGRALCETQH
jgi:hypothetical protein